MISFINFAQIIISLLLILIILLQAKGSGLSATFGGSGEFYRSRRGVEKILFRFTIILAFFFLLVSLIGVILR